MNLLCLLKDYERKKETQKQVANLILGASIESRTSGIKINRSVEMKNI